MEVSVDVENNMDSLNHGVLNNTPHERCVLYVEDCVMNATLIEEYFKQIDGFGLVVAETGADGIKAAQKHNPDLIIMDLNLPDIDGIEVMKCIRQCGGDLAHIPMIVLSADAMSEEIQKALKAGFSHYLTKPVFFDEFQAIVNQCVGVNQK